MNKFLCTFFVLMAGWSLSFAAEPDITAKLEAADAKVNYGNRLFAKISIINHTDDTIRCFIDFDHAWWLGLKATSGTITPVSHGAIQDYGVGATTVKAGQTYGANINLSNVLLVLTPGKVSLSYKLELSYIILPDIQYTTTRHHLESQGAFDVTIE